MLLIKIHFSLNESSIFIWNALSKYADNNHFNFSYAKIIIFLIIVILFAGFEIISSANIYDSLDD